MAPTLLLPADAGLDAFPVMTVDGGDLQALLRGQVVRAPMAGATNGVGDESTLARERP